MFLAVRHPLRSLLLSDNVLRPAKEASLFSIFKNRGTGSARYFADPFEADRQPQRLYCVMGTRTASCKLKSKLVASNMRAMRRLVLFCKRHGASNMAEFLGLRPASIFHHDVIVLKWLAANRANKLFTLGHSFRHRCRSIQQ